MIKSSNSSLLTKDMSLTVLHNIILHTSKFKHIFSTENAKYFIFTTKAQSNVLFKSKKRFRCTLSCELSIRPCRQIR